MTVEEMLDELHRYGFPNLFCSSSDGTWSCKTNLRVSVIGGEFTIKSDYHHSKPASAIGQCLDRVRDALHEIHKTAPTVPHDKPRLVSE